MQDPAEIEKEMGLEKVAQMKLEKSQQKQE